MKEYTVKTTRDSNKSFSTYPDICKSCGLCIEVCPTKCLSFSKNEREYLNLPLVEIDIQKCIGCGMCEYICPECAIAVEKKSSKR